MEAERSAHSTIPPCRGSRSPAPSCTVRRSTMAAAPWRLSSSRSLRQIDRGDRLARLLLRSKVGANGRHIRCRMTARRRAGAMIAFLPPRRRATCMPCPSLEPGPFLGSWEEHLHGLIKCRAHNGVPKPSDPPVVVGLTGLRAARMCADRLGNLVIMILMVSGCLVHSCRRSAIC